MGEATGRLLHEAARRLRSRRYRKVLSVALLVATSAALLLVLAGGILESTRLLVVPVEIAAPDTDGDGVPDAYENIVLGTDIAARASPGGLPELWVLTHDLNVSDTDLSNRTAPYPRPPESPAAYGPGGLPPRFRMLLGEVYAHGRPDDWVENEDGAWDSKLDPRRYDVDGSGVPYAWLIHFGLDPFDPELLDELPDVPGVTWTPREAYERGLHPLSTDGDGDGLHDEEELRIGTSPLEFSTTGTGVADGWLVAHGFDPLDPAVAYRDTDSDGLTNVEEFQASLRLRPVETLRGGGLDPRRSSTVQGPIPDGWIVRYALDPFDPLVHESVTQMRVSEDANGTREHVLTVLDEYRVNRPPLWREDLNGPWFGGTDPTKEDSDGDGLTDLEEILGWDLKIGGVTKRVRSDPTSADSDGDGLTDLEERLGKRGETVFPPTNPSAPDTDFDGLTDGEEIGIVPWRGVRLPVLDPTNEDSDGDGLLDGEEASYWMSRHEAYALLGRGYEWGRTPGASVRDVFARDGVSGDDVLALFSPGGDLDGDGVPNILDPDSDGDGLLDGWEVQPNLYRSSPYASDRPRPATDPANPDTDGDGLPDLWEVRYGLYEADLGGWNLDPSRWSSFGDDVGDGERDLDDDSVTWYSFHREGGRTRAIAHEFRATNLVEYGADSDPNRRSSSANGLSDGWTIFWGTVYPALPPEERGDVYPGAPGPLSIPLDRPMPRIGADENPVFAELVFARFAPKESYGLLPEERLDPTFVEPDHVRILGHATFDYRSAERNMTNPYLDDTDGDGIPDVWESVWSRVGRGLERVSPVNADSDLDLDEDGLDNLEEWRFGSDPYLPDADFGGATDDLEAALFLDPLDPTDDFRARDDSLDSDEDGVPDVVEIFGSRDAEGRLVFTDPNNEDTDLDGLLDGPSLHEILGRTISLSNPEDVEMLSRLESRGLIVVRYANGTATVPGEASLRSDPSTFSTARDGVPDGWAALHGFDPSVSSGYFTAYAYGRPTWWNDTQHGVWRWGLRPNEEASRDMDLDGLDDRNGEDPIPVANQRNSLALGRPDAPGIDRMEALRRAQAYGDSPGTRTTTLPPRAQVLLSLDPLPERLVANGSTAFSGNLTTVTGRPVRDATVLLALGSRELVMGVAITNETGQFRGPVVLADSLPAPAESLGVVVFGAADGTGVHVNADERLTGVDASRRVGVFAWTYNTSAHSPPRQAHPYPLLGGGEGTGVKGAESPVQMVNLSIPTRVDLDHVAVARTGETIWLNATLSDALARPVPSAVLRLLPWNETVVTDDNGTASVLVPLPDTPGPLTILASYVGAPPALLPSNSSSILSVLEPTEFTLIPPPLGARPGVPFAVIGSLLTSSGLPVADARVHVDVLATRNEAMTEADGVFRVVVSLPANAPLGDLTLEGGFAGNGTLSPSSGGLVLRVEGAPRWEAQRLVAPAGSLATLEARLVDAAGNALAGRSTSLVVTPGFTVSNVTDSQGRARFPLDLTRATPGGRTLLLQFVDPSHGSAEAPVNLTVTTTMRLQMSVEGLVRGSATTVTGSLLDGSGAPLAGQPVLVRVGPSSVRAVTDASGVYRATIEFGSETPLGSLRASARYAGSSDGIYLPAFHESTHVLRDAASLTVVSDVLVLSRPLVEGGLATRIGDPIVGREVLVHGPWGVIPASTNERGEFRLVPPIPASEPLGQITLRFVLRDEARLNGFDEPRHVLLKDAGRIVCRLPTSALQGSVASAPCSIVDSRDTPVPNARLTVSLGDETLSSTLSSGRLSFRIPHGVDPGPHRLRVTVDSDVVAAPPLEGTIEVRSPSSIVLLSTASVPAGAPSEIRLSIRSGGGGVPNATVLVFGDGPVPLRVTSNERGDVVVPVSAASARSAPYRVLFAGEGPHAAAALDVQVVAAPSTQGGASRLVAYVAGALLAASAAAAVWIYLSRHHGPARVLKRASRRLRSPNPDIRALYDAYLELLHLAGLSEDAAESLTFGDLLRRFIGSSPGTEPDLHVVTESFNRAVYAPNLLDSDLIERCSGALGRLAEKVRPETVLSRPDGAEGGVA